MVLAKLDVLLLYVMEDNVTKEIQIHANVMEEIVGKKVAVQRLVMEDTAVRIPPHLLDALVLLVVEQLFLLDQLLVYQE